ncbi:MAG: hypothetical protein J7J21_06090 [Methanomicrobia archaeon]|nr:hypothetical protein [Methanomicrobia archaeon]
MDILRVLGFLTLGVGIGVPLLYGIYKLIPLIFGSTPLWVCISIILICAGFLLLVASAIRDRLKEEKIEGVSD